MCLMLPTKPQVMFLPQFLKNKAIKKWRKLSKRVLLINRLTKQLKPKSKLSLILLQMKNLKEQLKMLRLRTRGNRMTNLRMKTIQNRIRLTLQTKMSKQAKMRNLGKMKN
uniref:Uncharacterized protein n=1 Tax=Cacopsylla melanoneura TaxID=428564 RepID=A0A8D8XR11_9HEMI